MSMNLLLPVFLDGTSIFVIMMLHRYAFSPHQILRRGSAMTGQSMDDTLMEPSVSAPSHSKFSLNGDYDDLQNNGNFNGAEKDISANQQFEFEKEVYVAAIN